MFYAWPFVAMGVRPLSVNVDPVQVLLMIRKGSDTMLFQPDESFMNGIAENLHRKTLRKKQLCVCVCMC